MWGIPWLILCTITIHILISLMESQSCMCSLTFLIVAIGSCLASVCVGMSKSAISSRKASLAARSGVLCHYYDSIRRCRRRFVFVGIVKSRLRCRSCKGIHHELRWSPIRSLFLFYSEIHHAPDHHAVRLISIRDSFSFEMTSIHHFRRVSLGIELLKKPSIIFCLIRKYLHMPSLIIVVCW